MKGLPLQDIIHVIGGRVIRGSGELLIKQVAKRINEATSLKANTLIFHLFEKRDTSFQVLRNIDRALCVVTETPERFQLASHSVQVVSVENIREALGKFVSYYRGLFSIPVIGITGTVGKTTTKEMVKWILEKDRRVVATYRSYNGLAHNLKYLLKINESTDAAVFEMGVDLPGDLRTSCGYFRPNIRVLLNIGVHHLRGCKTPARYRAAKGELLEDSSTDDVLIINADDTNILALDKSLFRGRVVSFGSVFGSDYRVTEVRHTGQGTFFAFRHGETEYRGSVPGHGKHDVYNALAAIAAAAAAGVDIQVACDRLADFRPVEQHLELRSGINGCTIIDDTWNSSSSSVEAALGLLAELSRGTTGTAILGDIPQLGTNSFAQREYSRLGEAVAQAGVDCLIVVGEEARSIGLSALKAGMESDRVHFCLSATQIYDALAPRLQKDSVILLKVTHRVMVEPSFAALREKLLVA